MENDGAREHWRRLALPLGISLAINLLLCGAFVRLSAAPPALEAGIAVELEGVKPPPPPPLPRPLLKRLFTPRQPDPPPATPETPERKKPTFFNRITQIFKHEDPPATPKPEEPPAAFEPEKIAANPPEREPVDPLPAPSLPDREPVKTADPPPPGPTAIDPGGESDGNRSGTVAPAGPGPGTESGGTGKDPGKGPGGDSHGTQIAIDPGGNNGGNPGGGTKNTGPGASSDTGPGPGTLDPGKEPGTGAGPGKDPDNTGDGVAPGAGTGDAAPANPAPRGASHGARVVKQSRPAYPAGAREEGVEGTVQLNVSLDAAGKVTETKILKSSGDRRLDRAAEKEIRKWTFEAKMEDGIAAAANIKVNVVFRLE